MKKINMGLLHYVFLMEIVLFITVSLSSCNVTDNVSLNCKDLIIDKLKGLHVPKSISLISDTSKVEEDKVDTIGNYELTGDFRYDNMFK